MSDRFYRRVRALSRPVLRGWFRLSTSGLAHIPRDGPCLVVANHSSYLDPAVLGRACPRKVHFLIRREVFDCAGLTWFFRRMDTIPVSLDRNDAGALKAALRRLEDGRVVGVFPEGGRSADGELAEAKIGAALLAARTGCPVVAAGIRGARAAMPVGAWLPRPRRIEVIFGHPFTVPAGRGRGHKARLTRVTDDMMSRIDAL
ncbi:MAG: lysophospholipid acyltransferase family protein, partial [Acidobacteriota bacterium]